MVQEGQIRASEKLLKTQTKKISLAQYACNMNWMHAPFVNFKFDSSTKVAVFTVFVSNYSQLSNLCTGHIFQVDLPPILGSKALYDNAI